MKKSSKLISGALAALMLCSAAAAAPVSVSALSAPAIKLSNTKKGVKITWEKVNGASKYTVSRRLSSAKSFGALKTVTANSYVDTKAKAGKKYVYTVTAVSSGTKAEAKSKTIIRLKAPSKLTVKSVSESSVSLGSLKYNKLSWKKVKGAKKYEIYRAKVTAKGTGKYTRIDTVKKASCGDYSAASGNFYKYKVRAVNGKIKGAFSSPSKKYGFLDAPYEVSVKPNPSYNAVRISWESVGAAGYKIYKSTDKGKSYKLLKSSKSFKKQSGSYYFDDTSVKLGGHYYYYVQAYTAKITSKKSDSKIKRIVFNDYDYAVEVGESKSESLWSGSAALYMTGMDISADSENEDIVKVSVIKSSSGACDIVITGVKEGYAFIKLKAGYDGETVSEGRMRVKVSSEPVYDLIVKKGEPSEIYELDDIIEMVALYKSLGMSLKISVTSGNTDVLRINNPKSADFEIVGISSGDAVVNVKISTSVDSQSMDLINKIYSVHVTD